VTPDRGDVGLSRVYPIAAAQQAVGARGRRAMRQPRKPCWRHPANHLKPSRLQSPSVTLMTEEAVHKFAGGRAAAGTDLGLVSSTVRGAEEGAEAVWRHALLR
jgi:hypothetical protein